MYYSSERFFLSLYSFSGRKFIYNFLVTAIVFFLFLYSDIHVDFVYILLVVFYFISLQILFFYLFSFIKFLFIICIILHNILLAVPFVFPRPRNILGAVFKAIFFISHTNTIQRNKKWIYRVVPFFDSLI